MHLNKRLKRFIIIGSSAAAVNFLAMILFVEVFAFNTYVLKNLANCVSIEISVLYNFLCCRTWTWSDAPKRQGVGLLAQFAFFNLAALGSILIRVIIFAILDKAGVHYLLNVFIGIVVTAIMNFFLYDKLIFRREDESQ